MAKNINSEENKNLKTPTNSVKGAKGQSKPKVANKNAKPKRSIGKLFKEISSELKKVSWPTFPKVVKQTGVVITVVAIFTLVLFGFDRLFAWLYNLLIS